MTEIKPKTNKPDLELQYVNFVNLDGNIHCIPKQDTKMIHIISPDCWCCPVNEWYEESIDKSMYRHHGIQ